MKRPMHVFARHDKEASCGEASLQVIGVLVAGVLLLVGVVFAIVFVAGHVLGSSAGPVFSNSGPTVEQLEAMGDLTVLKATFADVLEGKGSGYRGAWLVKGDALYAVDMRQARISSKDEDDLTAVLKLPTPAAKYARVDHNKTFSYSVEKTSWIPFAGDESKLRDESMREAQALIGRAAEDKEYVDIAKKNAELVLHEMYSLVGWDVEIHWE